VKSSHQLRVAEETRNKISSNNLTPLYPQERIKLETVVSQQAAG